MIFFYKSREILRDLFSIGSCSYEDDGALRFRDFRDELREHLLIDDWPADLLEMRRYILDIYFFARDILREFYSYYSWSF